jgi:hypothetical protein
MLAAVHFVGRPAASPALLHGWDTLSLCTHMQDVQAMMLQLGSHLSEALFVQQAVAVWTDHAAVPARLNPQPTGQDIEEHPHPSEPALSNAHGDNHGRCNLCSQMGELSILRGAKHTCIICLKLRWAGERKGLSRGVIRRAILQYGNRLPVSEFVQKTFALTAEDAADSTAATSAAQGGVCEAAPNAPAKRGRPSIGRRPRPARSQSQPLTEDSPRSRRGDSSESDDSPQRQCFHEAEDDEGGLARNGDTYRGQCIICGSHGLLSCSHKLKHTCRFCMPARALCHSKGLTLRTVQRMYEELGHVAPEEFAAAAAALASCPERDRAAPRHLSPSLHPGAGYNDMLWSKVQSGGTHEGDINSESEVWTLPCLGCLSLCACSMPVLCPYLSAHGRVRKIAMLKRVCVIAGHGR